MTAAFSAANRMPVQASVLAPAPLALGAPAEPCAVLPMTLPGLGLVVGTKRDERFGDASLLGGSSWLQYRHDSAQLAGGGPLRA